MIDLHAHTTASDGSLSPTELVNHAVEIGLEALGVADHDTIDGLEEAERAAKQSGLELVAGLEISAEFQPGTCHMLGLYIDRTNERLKQTLRFLQKARANRNPKIIGKLSDLGCPITMAEVEEIAGFGQIGRPHIAQALLNHGYVSTVQEAFDKYLKKGASAYVDKARLSLKDSVELIHDAGGFAILTHPITLDLPPSDLKEFVTELKTYGLDGIEVYYSDHTPEDVSYLLGLARELDLLISGGSDFHGASKRAIKLGTGRGNLSIPYEVLAAIKKARA